MIGDCVIIAQTMTARGIMTALLATDGSRCGAGVVGRYQRFGSIKAGNTDTAIPATASFSWRPNMDNTPVIPNRKFFTDTPRFPVVPAGTEYILRTGHAGSVADVLTGSAHIKRKKEEDLMTEKDKEIQNLRRVVEDQKKKIEDLTLRNQIQMQEETRLRREIESLKMMVDQLHERERVLLDT